MGHGSSFFKRDLPTPPAIAWKAFAVDLHAGTVQSSILGPNFLSFVSFALIWIALEFDFVPISNKLSFRFIMASEEYDGGFYECEYSVYSVVSFS